MMVYIIWALVLESCLLVLLLLGHYSGPYWSCHSFGWMCCGGLRHIMVMVVAEMGMVVMVSVSKSSCSNRKKLEKNRTATGFFCNWQLQFSLSEIKKPVLTSCNS